LWLNKIGKVILLHYKFTFTCNTSFIYTTNFN